MKKYKKVIGVIAAAAICLTICSCGKVPDTDIMKNGAESVVPSKTELVENTTKAGYTVTDFDDIYDLQVSGERVLAEKGDRYIDICYGLSSDDAMEVFDHYKGKYDPQINSEEYYILARNENFVYFISDKKTFKKSGFKSTDNIGEQFICK